MTMFRYFPDIFRTGPSVRARGGWPVHGGGCVPATTRCRVIQRTTGAGRISESYVLAAADCGRCAGVDVSAAADDLRSRGIGRSPGEESMLRKVSR